ncbi:MAG: YigZ family protein [Ignavibacteria bacterium]|nr:YigZ family protein [Ignavibacteria bacterium]
MNLETNDFYLTIQQRERASIKVRGSEFIATAIPVTSKEQAQKELEGLRSEFWDATHNCFAYRIGKGGLEFRTSDDGEPSGSAGKPILFVLNKYDVSDILMVVTRYYGGTKLGIGGLARAYSEAAGMVLEFCVKIPIYSSKDIRIMCIYEDVAIIRRIIEAYAINSDSEYRDAVEFIARIPESQCDAFIQEVISSTAGRAGAMIINREE